MNKIFFDSRICKFWEHSKLGSFIAPDQTPIFSISETCFMVSDFTFIEKLEDITYTRSIEEDLFCFALRNTSITSKQDFSKIWINNESNSLFRGAQYQSEIGRLLHTIFSYRMLFLNGISIHASVVVNGTEAIAFCGLSGAGKSTQANLWKEHVGSWVLNYDKPVIKFGDNRDCIVCGTLWSGKERCFINGGVKLKAIVFVEKAPINHVEKLSIADAYSMLYLNNLVYPINEMIEHLYDMQIEKVALNVPVYKLFCTKDIKAVKTLYEALYGENIWLNTTSERNLRMRIKKTYVLRRIADEYIVIPRGKETLNFQSTIVLNETGAFLWELLQESVTKDMLVSRMIVEYEVSQDIALRDIERFIDILKENHILEENQ